MIGSRISRTKTIDGVVTPAFIRNGSSFFINLQVYADGLVNCWGLVDLALFRDKLDTGWVQTRVPDGEPISIHGLGDWGITDGRWVLDADGLFARVSALVKQLNPRLENLHDCHGRTTEVIGKTNVSILGSPRERPVRFTGSELFPKRIDGDHRSIFVRVGDTFHLADLRAFADGTVELGRLPTPETLTVAELRAAIDAERVLSEPPIGARVAIHELGELTITDEHYATNIEELFREVPDLIDTANQRPDSIQRCRQAFEAFELDPSDARRDALREAYEAIPEHNRMYVGDMDTKDGAVRFALYGTAMDRDDD